MSKIRVGLIFGGRSGEHEVSLQSALSIQKNLNPSKYDVILLGINKKGVWHHVNSIHDLSSRTDSASSSISSDLITVCSNIDIFFPIIHGSFGEDGSIQGLFEILNKPFVGAGVLGSAIGMDKHVMKHVLQDSGIPVAEFMVVNANSYKKELEKIHNKLHFPLFVKPANAGSSVGVSKVKNYEELEPAILTALQYDKKVILEKSIQARELECSVLGNENPKASEIGEIKTSHEFYSYEAKYLDENGADLIIPAPLDIEIKRRLQELAIKTFKILECSGFARVDFFLDKENKIYVNEINTLPGFTSISMYPKLWEASGKKYSDLLDDIISFGFERKKSSDHIKRTYV